MRWRIDKGLYRLHFLCRFFAPFPVKTESHDAVHEDAPSKTARRLTLRYCKHIRPIHLVDHRIAGTNLNPGDSISYGMAIDSTEQCYVNHNRFVSTLGAFQPPKVARAQITTASRIISSPSKLPQSSAPCSHPHTLYFATFVMHVMPHPYYRKIPMAYPTHVIASPATSRAQHVPAPATVNGQPSSTTKRVRTQRKTNSARSSRNR